MVLVLDDLHLVTEQDTLDGLAYLLRNAAPGLRLVVSSRMDPLLPLHRYRLTGELTEIRADDLAFSVAESALLMAQQGITLSADGLERIVGRTEGWAAGVRLAAISLEGHPDPEQFAKEFDAEDSAVTSYLVDEVLNAQPASIRDFLLRTSILNQVSADIARELNDDEPATDLLPALAQANAFVRPVGHGWYRYHSLFAAVLRLKLRRECPGQVPELHRRAARWYQQNGSLSEAVRHAGESGDWPLAARIAVDELAIGQLVEPRGNRSLAERFPAHAGGVGLDGTASLARGRRDRAVRPGRVSGAVRRSPRRKASLSTFPLPAKSRPGWPPRRSGWPYPAASATWTRPPAAAARAESLLEEIPASHLARHPEIQAQVLVGRGAVELWSGDLDRAAATLNAASILASAAGANV